jgi:hypothetical protein
MSKRLCNSLVYNVILKIQDLKVIKLKKINKHEITIKLCIKHQLDAQIIIYSYKITIPIHFSSSKRVEKL